MRSHIERIHEKMQVHNNTEAVSRTLRECLLDRPIPPNMVLMSLAVLGSFARPERPITFIP